MLKDGTVPLHRQIHRIILEIIFWALTVLATDSNHLLILKISEKSCESI